MINLKDITKALKTILEDNLGTYDEQNRPKGYTIERNVRRNQDPDIAARGKGWIGIYRGKLSYEPGGIPKWSAAIEIVIELQVADHDSGEAEDRLQDAEQQLLNIFNTPLNRKLNSTVDMVTGFDIEYEFNAEEEIYHHSAIITLKAESRVSMV